MKEKLIELLIKTFDEQYEKRMLITPQHTAEFLIENGVTIADHQTEKGDEGK